MSSDPIIPSATPAEVDGEGYLIEITNGAAKRLKAIKDYYKIEKAKDVVGMALELLAGVQGSKDIVVRNPDGSAKLLTITPPSNGTTQAPTAA